MQDQHNIQKTALRVTRLVGSPISIVIHTFLFAGSFVAVWFGVLDFDRMLLVLTTIVSLEAIYLAIFIQMTINFQQASLEEVGEDIEEMQEDIGEIQEDVEEISEDVDELQEDVEEIGVDVEELSEEEETEEAAEERRKAEQRETLESIETSMQKLMEDIAHLKATRRPDNSAPLF